MSIDNVHKRGPGRPRKDEDRAVARGKRMRNTDSFQGKLSVGNKDPNYEYRWVQDKGDNGAVIFDLLNKDWEFCTSDQGLAISAYYIHNIENVGSIYRVPSDNEGNYLYLMRILKEYKEEDDARAQGKIDKREKGMFQAEKGDGQYSPYI